MLRDPQVAAPGDAHRAHDPVYQPRIGSVRSLEQRVP